MNIDYTNKIILIKHNELIFRLNKRLFPKQTFLEFPILLFQEKRISLNVCCYVE